MIPGIFARPREISVCERCVCRFWVPCPVPAPAAALPTQGNVHLLHPLPAVCQSHCVLAMVLMPQVLYNLLLLVQTNG